MNDRERIKKLREHRSHVGGMNLALDIATRALDNLDESTNELIKLRADNERLRSALDGMMQHSCIAEADWADKDAEDHAYESAALKALGGCGEGEI